jgi:hypothetical protein
MTRLLVIYLALKVYEEENGCLPPASITASDRSSLYSWRAALGTLVEGVTQWKSFRPSESWDSDANAPLRLEGWSFGFGYQGDSSAKFLGIAGLGTAFDREKYCTLAQMPPSLILVCEKCDSTIHWMRPGDIDSDTLEAEPTRTAGDVLCPTRSGFHVLFADGQIWRLSASTPATLLAKCVRGDEPQASPLITLPVIDSAAVCVRPSQPP